MAAALGSEGAIRYLHTMVRRIHLSGHLSNEQIKAIYDFAAKVGVAIRPWNEGPAADRSTFKWAAQGGYFAVRKIMKFLRTLP